MDETCHVDPIQKTPSAEEREAVQTTLLAVRGMGCPTCAARVRNGLLSLHGVVNATVEHTTGLAEVDFNPNLTNLQALVNAVGQAGGDGRHQYTARAYEEGSAILVL